MTPEQRYLRKLRKDAFHIDRTSGPRSPINRGRQQEANVHVNQLYHRSFRQLRILKAGNGAAEEDIGKFWFVEGYSLVGGPDIVQEA
mgnify:CR=1 FL=1